MNPVALKIVPVLALGLSACGLESLFFNAGAKQNARPVTKLAGTVPLDNPSLRVLGPDGSEVELVDQEITGGEYVVSLPSNSYDNLRVEAVQGEARLLAIAPHADPESSVAGVELTPATTMETLLIEGRLSAESKTLLVVTPGVIRGVLKLMRTNRELAGPTADLFAMVEKIAVGADPGAPENSPRNFVDPVLDAEFRTVTGALDQAWLDQASIDYTGDAMVDTSTAPFNAKFEETVKLYGFEGCLDPAKIRVVFTTNFNQGQLDGNCDAIQRFRWVRDEPGKQMFFVGGVHSESPIQDPELDAMMSNTGGWVPNQVKMFDDGTNGDEVAADNIWTVTFAMPRGIRVGYKYTWGHQGDLWTGSEEWPGNQHILEIADVNGDQIVYRADNFGDEATNKDKVNLNRRGNGTVSWDTDVNGDGVPDARERMLDRDNNCVLDAWVTPRGVGPVTVDCELIGQ